MNKCLFFVGRGYFRFVVHHGKVDVFVMKYACILSLILVLSALGREKEEYAKQERKRIPHFFRNQRKNGKSLLNDF